MKENNIIQIRVGRLYKIAEEIRKNITDEDEIEKIDRTQDLLYELEYMIKNGEIIIININAKTRMGKSTLGIGIGQHIFKLLKKHGYKKQNEQFGMKNIDRDQQEHSKRMRDPKTAFTVQVVDESNALEMGGENSSTEKALAQVFSDVQAGRYVHKVCCSPKEIIDNNSDIIISVIGMEKSIGITHAKLYYRYYEGGQEYTILLGYIRWNVLKLTKNWNEKAKKLFYKQEKTEQEQKELNKLEKKDFYVEYMIKKYEKMNLLTQEGIFRPRILDYAEAITNVVEKLKKLTSMTNLINANIVRNYVKIECKNQKIPLSIVGEELATREVMGLLDLHKAVNKLKKQREKTKGEMSKLGRTEELTEKQTRIKQMLVELATAIDIQEKEYEKYAEIQKKYNKTTEEKGG